MPEPAIQLAILTKFVLASRGVNFTPNDIAEICAIPLEVVLLNMNALREKEILEIDPNLANPNAAASAYRMTKFRYQSFVQ